MWFKSKYERAFATNDATYQLIYGDRAQTAKREVRLLSRFTGANPTVPIVGVPSLPFDVSDLEALRVIADQLTAVKAA